jgi:hypothetical protein
MGKGELLSGGLGALARLSWGWAVIERGGKRRLEEVVIGLLSTRDLIFSQQQAVLTRIARGETLIAGWKLNTDWRVAVSTTRGRLEIRLSVW